MAGHIRKRKTKDGRSWQVTVECGPEAGGERRRIYKTVNGTRKEAERVMNQMLSELQNGTLVEPSKMTISEYMREWFDTYVVPNLSPTSADGYKINIERHILPALGHIRLQELNPMHLQRFYQQKMENGRVDGKGGLSAKSVLYIHRNIHEALEHAVRMQLIPRNSASLVKLPRAQRFKSNVYDETQLKQMLQAAQGTDMEAPLILAAAFGLRRGEMLGLRWENVDLNSRTIEIVDNLVHTNAGTISKSPKSESSQRTLQMPDGLVPVLKRIRLLQAERKLAFGPAYADQGFVCCKQDGTPWDPSYFSRKFAAFLKKNGLPHIRLHDLRHSHATMLMQLGVPAKVASQRLGHASVSITLDLYSHVLSDAQKDAAAKIDAGLFQAVGKA